jgi:hypothetical protein
MPSLVVGKEKVMASTEIHLNLTVTEADADAEWLERLTGNLMRDLRELGVESVERPSGGPAPEGAKGSTSTVGALALVAVPTFLPKLVDFLQAWSLRGESRIVRIKTPAGLEVEFTPDKRLSQAELIALVEKLTAGTPVADAILEQEQVEPSSRTKLRQLLSTHFNEGELRILCFDLNLEYDDLIGAGPTDKARELVSYLERHSRIDELLVVGKRMRPDVPWE